jgi:transcriptional regulator with XRE-family HTH domain
VNWANRSARRLALLQRWWILWRDNEPVQSALIRVRADHLNTVIGAALKRNRVAKRAPASFTELAEELNRDKVNVWRWRTGQHAPNVADVLSLAQILGIGVGTLFEPEPDALRRVIRRLCPSLSERDARAYSAYVSSSAWSQDTTLNRRALDDVVTCSGYHDLTHEDAAESIWRVADGLEPVLERAALGGTHEGSRREGAW